MTTNNSIYYGYFSGLITAATLQPLDNIKMTVMVPPPSLRLSSNCARNVYLAARHIKIEEGFTYFYRGLIPNIWKTGLGSGVYFSTLRLLEKSYNSANYFGQFVASGLARIVSCVVTNPFAVAETRYQVSGSDMWKGRLSSNMKTMYKNEGIQSFFKGCNASCLKEAGFAAFYYPLYTKAKSLGGDSVTSGMLAGMLSTLTTHPLEIVRTKTQRMNSAQISISRELINLIKTGSLFDGVLPRLVKKPAANTLGFVLFEYFEKYNSEKCE